MRTRGRTPGGTPTRMPTVTPSTPQIPAGPALRPGTAPVRRRQRRQARRSLLPPALRVGARRDQRDAGDAGSGRVPDPRGRARGDARPQVTGCLPTLTGDATRAAQVFLEGSKEYVSVLELHGSPPADFRDVVAEFEAEIYQKPPRKSAVTRRLRTRTIYDLDVLEVDDRQALPDPV